MFTAGIEHKISFRNFVFLLKKKILTKDMTIDSISDMATTIRNAIVIKNSLVTLPYTKNNEIIAKILAKEGFIHCVTTTNKTNFGISSSDSIKKSDRGSFQKNDKIAERISKHNNTLSINTPIDETNNTRFDINQNVEKENNQTSEKQKFNLGLDPEVTPGNSSSGETLQNSRFYSASLSSKFTSNGINEKVIILALKYVGREKKPMIHAIKRISKPSLRWYSQNPIPQSLGGLGVFIVSTSFGITTDKEA